MDHDINISFQPGKRLRKYDTGKLCTVPDKKTTGFFLELHGVYQYQIGNYYFDSFSAHYNVYETEILYKDRVFGAYLSFETGLVLNLTENNSTIYRESVGLTNSQLSGLGRHERHRLLELLVSNYLTADEEKRIQAEAESAEEESYFANIGKEVKPEVVELVEEEVELNVQGSSLQEQFISIVGEVSELTQQINSDTMLGDNADIAESFIKAKEEISKLTSKKPDTPTSFFSKYFGSNKYVQKAMKHAKEIKAENDSIQKNINHIFGIIHTKYEKLVETGQALQKTKALLSAQIEALQKLADESTQKLTSYTTQTDIPMQELQLDTQIKASIEKYHSRLTKIDSSIMATQATIIKLGKELPAMKSDIVDEMAIGALLSNVDDYQQMFQEISSLGSDIMKSTSEQTHTVVENLLDLLTNDTSTVDYLLEQTERNKKYGAMIADKSQKYAAKVQNDAVQIATIVNTNSQLEARKAMKLLK